MAERGRKGLHLELVHPTVCSFFTSDGISMYALFNAYSESSREEWESVKAKKLAEGEAIVASSGTTIEAKARLLVAGFALAFQDPREAFAVSMYHLSNFGRGQRPDRVHVPPLTLSLVRPAPAATENWVGLSVDKVYWSDIEPGVTDPV